MHVAIQQYFSENYTDEMQLVLGDAIGLFDRLNIDVYEGFIINMLSTAEESDSVFLDQQITSYIEGLLISLEKAFGFQLFDNDVVTLSQRVAFIRGYVDLEDYIDHETIIRIIETDNLDQEKLAEAISLTTDMGEETILSLILSVEEEAIFTLKRLHISDMESKEKLDEIDDPAASKEQITQVKAYRLFVAEHHLTVNSFLMIQEGYAIGLPFKVYWDQKKDELLELDHANLCMEIIAIFLLSKEYWSNPLLALDKWVQEWFDNITIAANITSTIRQLMGNFMKFKADNRIK